jgi:hypothetical protein
MAKTKQEESWDRETEQAVQLGKNNADLIQKARYWCKNFRIKMVSAGILAKTLGLPIGSHRISCQFALDESEAIDLQLIIPEFIVKNCKGCQYQEPNGGLIWGQDLIIQAEKRELELGEQEKKWRNQLTALREQLRTRSHHAKQATKLTDHQILYFLEKMF